MKKGDIMTDDKKSKWRYKVYHELYVDMAISQFNIAQDAYIELMNQENEEPTGRTYELLDLIKKNSIGTICFSVMALESYINTISSVYISKSFAETIDHLDIVAKWVIVARVGTNIELKRGEAPIQRIAQSVKLRNQFVHSKSKSVDFLPDGQAQVPNINVKTEFVEPAYESLMAIRDVFTWIGSSWPDCVLTICDKDIESKIKKTFKTTDNIWCFMETVVIC